MEGQNTYKVIAGVLAVVLFFLHFQYLDVKRENDSLSSALDDYEYALDEANENIDDANSQIEDAQSYAWTDYYEMGYALENLSTVDTVSAP